MENKPPRASTKVCPHLTTSQETVNCLGSACSQWQPHTWFVVELPKGGSRISIVPELYANPTGDRRKAMPIKCGACGLSTSSQIMEDA